ncbi:MAG: hypothetical protein AB8G11_11560 [Saprospiraceae bacterium]
MKQILFLGLLTITLIYGCVEPPDYPIQPVIEFVEMSRTSVTAQTSPPDINRALDTLYITFSFTDGDGDLGGGSFDSTNQNVHLIDSRIGVVDASYSVDDLPNAGVTNGISGEMTVRIPEIFCLDSEPRDTLTYTIQIIDRAGNLSNEIQTPPIELICD